SISVAAAATVVAPELLRLPPVQVNRPLMVTAPPPVIVPAVRLLSPARLKVPVCTSTLPVLLNTSPPPNVVVPLPADLRNVRALLNVGTTPLLCKTAASF